MTSAIENLTEGNGTIEDLFPESMTRISALLVRNLDHVCSIHIAGVQRLTRDTSLTLPQELLRILRIIRPLIDMARRWTPTHDVLRLQPRLWETKKLGVNLAGMTYYLRAVQKLQGNVTRRARLLHQLQYLRSVLMFGGIPSWTQNLRQHPNRPNPHHPHLRHLQYPLPWFLLRRFPQLPNQTYPLDYRPRLQRDQKLIVLPSGNLQILYHRARRQVRFWMSSQHLPNRYAVNRARHLRHRHTVTLSHQIPTRTPSQQLWQPTVLLVQQLLLLQAQRLPRELHPQDRKQL